MDWLELNQDLLLYAAAAGGFVAGVVVTRFAMRHAVKRIKSDVDRRDHQIRELEADLRVAERQLADYTAKLEAKTEECDRSMDTVTDLNALLDNRNSEVEQLREEVRDAVKKTRDLRRELSEKAEETMREYVRAKEAQDELDVVRAGSEAIMSEFSRLRDDENGPEESGAEQQELLSEDLLADDDDRPTAG